MQCSRAMQGDHGSYEWGLEVDRLLQDVWHELSATACGLIEGVQLSESPRRLGLPHGFVKCEQAHTAANKVRSSRSCPVVDALLQWTALTRQSTCTTHCACGPRPTELRRRRLWLKVQLVFCYTCKGRIMTLWWLTCLSMCCELIRRS